MSALGRRDPAADLRTPDRAPVDVAGLPPLEQHAAVLAEWQLCEDLYAALFLESYKKSRAQQQLAGRRRILERHAPHLDDCPTHPVACHYEQHGDVWPCPDYLDASAGLVVGLEPTA